MASSRKIGVNENISTYGDGTRDYTSLSAWEAATDTDLVTAAQSEVLECYDDVASFDDNVKLDGAITSSSYFRIIRPASGQGHDGTPNNGFTLASTTDVSSGVIGINENYSQAQNIIGKLNISSSNTREVFTSSFGYTESAIVGCIGFDSSNSGSGKVGGIRSHSAHIVNCLIHNCDGNGVYSYPYNAGNTLVVSNVTVEGCGGDGVRFNSSNATPVLKNVLSTNNAGSDFSRSSGSGSDVGYCASSDATADDWGANNNRINQAFTFVSPVGDDFHLASGDTGSKDYGADLSGDTNYAFDDDIDGDTRSGTWDIGADEFVSGGILVQKDAVIPEGWRSALQKDGLMNTDYLSLLNLDRQMPADFLVELLSDKTIQTSFLQATAKDAQIPADLIAMFAADRQCPSSWAIPVGADRQAAIEFLVKAVKDAQIPIEWTGGVLVVTKDAVIPVDYISLVVISKQIPVDRRAWIVLDWVLKFNGVNQYVDIGSQSELDFGSGDFTIEAWVEMNDTVERGVIFSKGSTVGQGYLLEMLPTGKLSFQVRTSYGWENTHIGINTYNDGKWHHIVLTKTGTTLNLYGDGSLDASLTLGAADILNTASYSALIAWENGFAANWSFNGNIDGVRIYNRVLSPTEISEHYQSVFDDETGLILHLPFNEGGGTTAADASGNGNNGTLVNSPTWVHQNYINIEFLKKIAANKQISLEFLFQAAKDVKIFTDWLNAIQTDKGIPASYVNFIQRDGQTAIEWLIPAFTDRQAIIEWLEKVFGDALLQVEFEGITVKAILATFVLKKPSIAFTMKQPTMTFGMKKPSIDFDMKGKIN